MTRPFKKGDVVKLVSAADVGYGIDAVTSYTLTRDEYTFIDKYQVIEFKDNKGDGRMREAKDYTLVSRPGEAEVNNVLTVKIDASEIEAIPAVKLERVGDKVEVAIIGKLSKEQVAALLDVVFGN